MPQEIIIKEDEGEKASVNPVAKPFIISSSRKARDLTFKNFQKLREFGADV